MSQRKENELVVEYQGYKNGPLLRRIRKERRFTIEMVCELAGISTSTLSQLEQGGRNLSMRNLYHLMRIYNVDANTLLGVPKMVAGNSIDESLKTLSLRKRDFLTSSFLYMIERAVEEGEDD